MLTCSLTADRNKCVYLQCDVGMRVLLASVCVSQAVG